MLAARPVTVNNDGAPTGRRLPCAQIAAPDSEAGTDRSAGLRLHCPETGIMRTGCGLTPMAWRRIGALQVPQPTFQR